MGNKDRCRTTTKHGKTETVIIFHVKYLYWLRTGYGSRTILNGDQKYLCRRCDTETGDAVVSSNSVKLLIIYLFVTTVTLAYIGEKS